MIKYLVMKRIILSIILLFALSACSFNDVVALLITPTVPPPPPTDTATPTVFYTPSQTPTITPVPSFTSTPTRSGIESEFDESSFDAEPLPTLILVPTNTPGPQISFFSEPGSIIFSVSVSSDVLLWGYCSAPKYVDFDVKLTSTVRVTYVMLFWRLVDKGGNQSTTWGGGAIMEKRAGGFYTYRVTPDKLEHYNEFKDAWIEYQVIVTTGGLNTLDRSPVSRDSLSLQYCQPVEVDE